MTTTNDEKRIWKNLAKISLCVTLVYYTWMIYAWVTADDYRHQKAVAERIDAMSNAELRVAYEKAKKEDLESARLKKEKSFPGSSFKFDEDGLKVNGHSKLVSTSSKGSYIDRMNELGLLKPLDNLSVKYQQGRELPDYGFFIQKPFYRCESSLRINTSGKDGHVVKLYDLDDRCTALMYYVPPGETREIDVPVGRYELRYASGTRWFGGAELFGHMGAFAKADRIFEFPRGGGYEITLYTVRNGNLGTRSIREEDF